MKDLLQGIVFVGLFLIPFLPVYVENDFFFPFITGKNFAFRIIIEVVFAAWVLLALFDAKYRPQFSWILAGFASLLGVMAVANALGEYPLQSFWSNFERMDGYVTLVHVFLLTLVMGSVFTTKNVWSYFIHTTVAIALLVALHGLAQYFGVIAGSDNSRIRIDSRLGNAAYMAIYMLFHIFLLLFLFVRAHATVHRALYVLIALIFSVTLLLTGTRGTFIGLVGGFMVTIGYVALFGRAFPEVRKFAIYACIAVALLGVGFYALKDSAIVQENTALARIANISLSNDLDVREKIWTMAVTGIKERPLLGWGQSNFNYVFNKEYDPALFAAESWYDRTHNLIFDWLITGGIFGLVAYLSVLVACAYYLLVEPLRTTTEPRLNVLERGVLLGLLSGYIVHNLVVFDNIISYIFFGVVLALIHVHVATPIARIQNYRIDTDLITQFVTPLVVIVAAATVYFVNVPGIGAAGDIIDAMTATTVKERLAEFHTAIERHSFAHQEITEQLAQQALAVLRNPNVSQEEKQGMVQRAELELLRLADEKPGDARVHAFLTNFYRSIGAIDQARTQAAIARSLSPQKQAIILEQGIVEVQGGDLPKANEFFKEALMLDERNTQARVFYAATLINEGKKSEAEALLVTPAHFDAFAANDYALSTVEASKDRALLARMFESRISRDPSNSQYRASLAFIYYELKDTKKAVEVLTQAAKDIPEFAESAECLSTNIQKGIKPDTGCSPS